MRIPYLSRLLEIKEFQIEIEKDLYVLNKMNHVILDDIRDILLDIKKELKGGKKQNGRSN